MAIKVTLKHKDFGEVVIENITEIHYCYPSPMGKRIAFESDIDGTGYTYDVADVIEFEATEQSAGRTPSKRGRKASKVGIVKLINLP